jgi:hypothetical protein
MPSAGSGFPAGIAAGPGGKTERRTGDGSERGDSARERSVSRSIPAAGEALRDFTTRVLRDSDPIRRTSGFMRILDRSTPDNFHHIHQAWKDLRFAGTYTISWK